MRALYALLSAGLIGACLVAACGNDSGDSTFGDNDSGTVVDPGPGPILNADGSADPDAQIAFTITPVDPVVTYTSGQPAPTVQFTAKTDQGVTVPATFSIDRGELGSMTTAGLFTASGKVGGKGTVTATLNGRTATTTVTVKLTVEQNGDTASDAGTGAGGNGGVGGEGPGAAVDAATVTVLKGTPTADSGLAWLYPYDKTVWPRGILAPLLQWQPGAQATYDAVRIQITEDAFTYDGFFAKTATPFIHHPIPQAAWKAMLQSNGGEDVTITLTFAKNGVAYGPISEKWKVASAPLKGTVYYNSYGTKLAQNYTGALPGNGLFGGATLAIKGGSTDPVLVAGTNVVSSGCRVCHSVASNGSKLITQRDLGDQRKFSTYDLKTGAETTMSPEGTGANFAWPAIYPDGSMFLGDSSSAAGSSTAVNGLFLTPSGAGPVTPTAVTTTGWPANFRAAYPAFSPDGKNLAFTMFAGATGADTKTLGMMTFDNGTKAWGPLVTLHKPAGTNTALYPAFLPDGKGIIFHLETRYNGRDYGGTRSDADNSTATDGTHAELWYLDLATKTATRLDQLNGKGYLPSNAATNHADDTIYNYEPTVNPVVSGGYAWVVFTSRRMYGNVATINPFFSDPRFHDLTSTPTTKKLWVAAIDLNAPAGTDPSHPAFYLPAQELLAGNSRGYWVVDPCHSNGTTCESGDECCGGYCRPDNTGALVCSDQKPVCAQEFDKCTVDGDCCNSPTYTCINGRCSLPLPR